MKVKFVKIGLSGIIKPQNATWHVDKIGSETAKAVWRARRAKVKKKELLFMFNSFSSCFYCNCAVFRPYL